MWQVLILSIILLKGITPADSNTIESIHRVIDVTNFSEKTKFCLLETPPAATAFQLVPTVAGNKEDPIESEYFDGDKCITFVWDIISRVGNLTYLVIRTSELIPNKIAEATVTVPDTLVVSSVLKYLPTDRAEINIKIKNSADSVDILFKSTLPGGNKACKGNTGTTATCEIPWIAGNRVADLRIATVSRNLMTNYNKNPIQDHKLSLQGISSTTVEAEWLQNSVNKFKLTAYKEDATESTDIVTVDCSNLVAYCLGFVTGLDTNTLYSVVLQQYDKASSEYSTVNQIQSLSAQTLSAKAEIHHIRMDCHHNGKGSTVQVCFQHTSDDYEERKHSRYELVLLNDNRQWLRHKLITNETGDLCFSPISVNPVDFDIHQGVTLIVTNRAQDEVTVLATGETYISIN